MTHLHIVVLLPWCSKWPFFNRFPYYITLCIPLFCKPNYMTSSSQQPAFCTPNNTNWYALQTIYYWTVSLLLPTYEIHKTHISFSAHWFQTNLRSSLRVKHYVSFFTKQHGKINIVYGWSLEFCKVDGVTAISELNHCVLSHTFSELILLFISNTNLNSVTVNAKVRSDCDR